jgi:cytochrome c peroxidase
MICTTKMLNRIALSAVLAVGIFGCAEPKKAVDAPADPKAASTTDSTTSEVAASDAPPAAAPGPVAATSETTPAAGTTAEAKPANGKVMLGSPELTAGIPGEGPLKLAELEGWLNDPRNHEALDFELQLGLAAGMSQVQGIDKNPLTRAKIELGRQLYFDPRLSSDVKISCASCHHPEEGFGRHTQFGVGIREQTGGRNSPISYNRILSGPQFWDGRAGSLEDQAVGPIANAIEMGNTHEGCVECLKAIPEYKLQFEKIFGKMDIDAVGQALATFERAIVTEPAPFDYYERLRPFEKLDADEIKEDPDLAATFEVASAEAKAHPMTDSAKRGRDVFFSEKGGCSACHVGANLTDEKYHNIGIGMDKEKPDIGREEVTKDPKDRGAFKTPTIRNVAHSTPYMHDGSIATLEEVVEWYAKGGHPNPNLSEKIKKLDLSVEDKKDLVEFMKQGCTSAFPKIATGRLPQ